jgi:hypothetical protein
MTKNQPAWMKCLSANLFNEATLSCSEYRAFQYRKCDGCPNSEFMIQTPELSDPMNSVITYRWIRGLDSVGSTIGLRAES